MGTIGHGRIGSVAGSVSRAMIVHAGCPVAVVPPAAAVPLSAGPAAHRATG